MLTLGFNQFSECYFLVCNGWYFNWQLVRELKISKEDYEEFLNIRPMSAEFYTFGFTSFDTKEEAERKMEKLESLIIMNKLMGD